MTNIFRESRTISSFHYAGGRLLQNAIQYNIDFTFIALLHVISFYTARDRKYVNEKGKMRQVSQ